MGICFSSESSLHTSRQREITTEHGGGGANSLRESSASVSVIGLEGKVQKYSESIKAKEVISENPNCFLCSAETMRVGSRVPRLPDDEDLQSEQIYFLMPMSRAHLPLTLPELCELAIATSSVLDRAGAESGFGNRE